VIRRALLPVLVAIALVSSAAPLRAGDDEPFQLRKVERLYLDNLLAAPGGERVVELYLRAETKYGEISDLRPVDLVIRDNDELVELVEVQEGRKIVPLSKTGDRGIAAVLAIDTSRTMKGEPLERAKEAALAFMERLGSFDRIAVVSFSGEVEVVTPFDAPRARARTAIEGLEETQKSLSTVLWDGVYESIQMLRSDPSLPRRGFVIVFSDGTDGGSTHQLDELIELGRGDGMQPRTPIFTVGYTGFGGDLEEMEKLSRGTGAQAFKATSTIHLADFFSEIWRQMMGTFVVRFPADMDGGQHTIVVEIDDLSDSMTTTYPSIRGPLLPWLIGAALLLVLVAAIALTGRSRRFGRLVFVSGPRAGESIALKGTKLRIGALPDNDIVVDAPTVSRYHAQIQRRRRDVEIHDLDARNGTFLNGTAVRVSSLRPGDKIRIGEVDMVYER